MRVLGVVLLVALATSSVSCADDNSEDQSLPETQPSKTEAHDEAVTDNKRRKKSATTTLCVEIRPGPDQKPYQVCDPPSYPATDSPAPQSLVYTAPKPGPSYVLPGKPYSAPAPAPKPYAASHSSSYTNFRDAEQDMISSEHMNMMNSNEESVVSMMRKAGGYGGYGAPSYGAPPPLAPPYGGFAGHASGSHSLNFVPAEYKKKPHSGLVITCQPNLAGYSHGVAPGAPSSSGYYRSSTSGYNRPYSYGSYSPPATYGAMNYGGYKAPAPAPAPAYAPPPKVYSPPAPAYVPPPPPTYIPQPPAPAPAPPTYSAPPAPQPAYSPPPPAPVYSPPPAPVKPYSPPAPAYAPPPKPPVYSYPSPPAYKAPPTYGGAYRNAEEERMMPLKMKELHTMKKMDEVTKERAADAEKKDLMMKDMKKKDSLTEDEKVGDMHESIKSVNEQMLMMNDDKMRAAESGKQNNWSLLSPDKTGWNANMRNNEEETENELD